MGKNVITIESFVKKKTVKMHFLDFEQKARPTKMKNEDPKLNDETK